MEIAIAGLDAVLKVGDLRSGLIDAVLEVAGRVRPPRWDPCEVVTLVILPRGGVDETLHVVIGDAELRERVRPYIHPSRMNHHGDDAVLVIAPAR